VRDGGCWPSHSRVPFTLVLSAATAEQVPEFFLLGLQIIVGVFGGRNFTGNPLAHANSGAFEGRDFVGIVREKANLPDAKGAKDLGRHEEFALVGLKTKALIGLDGIETAVLQGVGLEFRHQSNSAAFLLLIDQNARTFLGDHGERHFQLLPAIATQGTEDVSGEALRVNSNQRRTALDIAHDQRNRIFRLGGRDAEGKAMNEEMPPARGELGRRHLFDLKRAHPKII
jgi:hypothetical protein